MGSWRCSTEEGMSKVMHAAMAMDTMILQDLGTIMGRSLLKHSPRAGRTAPLARESARERRSENLRAPECAPNQSSFWRMCRDRRLPPSMEKWIPSLARMRTLDPSTSLK